MGWVAFPGLLPGLSEFGCWASRGWLLALQWSMLRLAVVGVVFALLSGSAFAQNEFPSIPKSQQPYRAYRRLVMLGFVSGNTGLGDFKTDRAPMAAALIRGIEGLPMALDSLQKQFEALPVGHFESDVSLFARSLFDDFRLVIGSVGDEVRAKHRDPDRLLRQLNACRPRANAVAAELMKHLPSTPFRDVPASHWAWESVQELKDAGILSGYPDGSFRG